MDTKEVSTQSLKIVGQRELAILRFTCTEWSTILDRPAGIRRFTFNCDLSQLNGLRPPTFCLIYADSYYFDGPLAYVGILKSKRKTATLGGTVSIRDCRAISPKRIGDLTRRLKDRRYHNEFSDRTRGDGHTRLPRGLASAVVEVLLGSKKNASAFSALLRSDLLVPNRRKPASMRLQSNAIQMALAISGIAKDATPIQLELEDDDETALYELEGRLQEDSVIAHDARQIPGMNFVGSRLTGVARFAHRNTIVDVITANKLPIEEVMGVDLVYINETQRNVVLVQYKMLERNGNDWIYRPNQQLADELARMKTLALLEGATGSHYRLSSEYQFLKFVKRDEASFGAPVILPVSHYSQLRRSKAHKGPKGAFRVSYNSLGGHYLREQPFVELIRDGYIGSYPSTTANIKAMIRKLIKEGRPAVIALRRHLQN